MSHSKQQKRKNKKYVPRKLGNVAILNRLPVPESQVLHLKARHDAILLRLYMGTDTFQDQCELFSILRLGQVLAKYANEADKIAQSLDEAIAFLAHLPEPSETSHRNLDVLKDALELCENVWRLVTVEEFVREAQKLKKSDT